MKILFLIFHGFDETNGISKKIHYQVDALKTCGIDTRICWLEEKNGHKYRMIDDTILEDYGTGLKSKLLKRTGLNCIYQYIIEHKIDIVYARSDHNTTPFLINFYRKLKKKNIKIGLEIPTYPYDQEYKELPFGYQWILFLDKCLRKRMARYIDKIITFSDDKVIFGRPTIRISNGIDFNEIPLKKTLSHLENELHLIAVATIHPWHGFDRAINGLIDYYKNETNYKVYLHIVGQGVPRIVKEYKDLVMNNKLEKYVIFHGPLFGAELNDVFNQCQLGIGSLARHRSGITHLRSLKNREYAARGIPFVYSEIDEDFERRPYIMKIEANESPISIDRIIAFYQSIKLQPQYIRESISSTLSWKEQMLIVLNNL